MLGAKSGKVLTSDEMYKKATDEGIPFFTWHDWLKAQMN